MSLRQSLPEWIAGAPIRERRRRWRTLGRRVVGLASVAWAWLTPLVGAAWWGVQGAALAAPICAAVLLWALGGGR